MKPLFTLLTVLALGLMLPGMLLATTLYFNDEDAFHDATGTLSLESFEGLTAANDFTADSFALADFTVTGNYTTPCLGIWNEPFVGGFATDGENWLGYQSDDNLTLVFEFTVPINTFGLYITDWGDFGTGVLTFANEAGDFFQVAVTPQSNGNSMFFGTWNDQMIFTIVTFTQTISGEFYGVDEIYYGVTSTVALEAKNWSAVKALFD